MDIKYTEVNMFLVKFLTKLKNGLVGRCSCKRPFEMLEHESE